MCGNAVTLTPPKPVISAPDRHQIRNAIRKVARTLKGGSIGAWDLADRCMTQNGWNQLSSHDYYKTFKKIEDSAKKSLFFDVQEGVCGNVKLSLRPGVQL